MRRAESGGTSTTVYGTEAPDRQLREAFRSGSVPVAVHGLGRIGLPVAAVFAELTGDVTGVDVDPSVVDAVQRGEAPVDEPDLDDLVADLVEDGALRATTDPDSVEATVHVLVVPTLVDDDSPDLSPLLAATRAVGRTLAPGDLVVVESTVPPGTCTEEVVPTLAAESGLDPGEFGVAHCPERTASGRALRDVRGAYPRVVGGVDAASTRAAGLVYDELTHNEVLAAADARTAECVKLFEGVYRDVNIALANEFARMAGDLGVDVPEAIRLANTQPYCDLHSPGPGVGGHCIPYYPYFLTDAVDDDARLVGAARSINDSMPAHTAGELARALAADGVSIGDASVAVMGLAYRAGVSGTRESPGIALAGLLSVLGADVYGVDPMVSTGDVPNLELVPVEALADLSTRLDAAVVATPHDAFLDLDWAELDPMVVLDGRDALDLADTHHAALTLGDGSGPPPARGTVTDIEGRSPTPTGTPREGGTDGDSGGG